MDFVLDWTESALLDLEQIVRFISQDDPIAANRWEKGSLAASSSFEPFQEVEDLFLKQPKNASERFGIRPIALSTKYMINRRS